MSDVCLGTEAEVAVMKPDSSIKGKGRKKEWRREELLEEISKSLVEAGITEDTEEFVRVMTRGRFDFEDT